MGQSTDAILVYGIDLGDPDDGDFPELPWDSEEYGEESEGMEGRLVTWWRQLHGFINPHEEPYDGEGNWKRKFLKNPNSTTYEGRHEMNELGDLAWKAWSDATKSWDKSNPLPIELVSHCSGKCPMWIIAAPDTIITAWRGHPVSLGNSLPGSVPRSPYPVHSYEFLAEHLPEVSRNFTWILCSNWN